MSVSNVEFVSDGAAITGVLARPDHAKAGLPGLLVIHEWWGLTSHITDVASRFANEGFVALVPDLYSRLGHQVAGNEDEAAQLMTRLSAQEALRDLNAATRCLKDQPFVDGRRLGVVGFSMGGTFALTMACHNSDLRAAVPFYGKVPPQESLKYLLCPVLYHYGAKDDWVTKQEVDQLKEGFAKFGKPGEVAAYPRAGHGFFNDARAGSFQAEDAAAAWRRTLRFLQQYLR